MSWFSRRREARDNERAATLAGALVQALAETAKSQAQFGSMVGGWIKDLGDLSVKRSAQLMGTRSGAIRKERKKAANKAYNQGLCPLCIDQNYRDVSVAMITAHRGHNAMPNGLDSSQVPATDYGVPGTSSEPGR
jgi:hypothetical protein